ncbi:AAA family ATPase [Butyrivibrio sp. XBB1001]|uniref:AAA family ATPase n=1 Tax=Butyrivibrio sp. XBB1001 TaxID=1280682 RepID=UPI000425A7E8|nr:AAA family ATPase [Butyrivibrio sp. XBB1001]
MKYFIDTFTDEELKTIVRASGIRNWLEPFKRNSRHFAKYMPRLGNLKTNSPMVNKNLPGIVVEVFRSQDRNFVLNLEKVARDMANDLAKTASEVFGEDITEDRIAHLSDEEIADFIIQFDKGVDPDTGRKNRIDFELLWVQFKLHGVEISDDRKEHILNLCSDDVPKAKELLGKAISNQENTDSVLGLEDNIDEYQSVLEELEKSSDDENVAGEGSENDNSVDNNDFEEADNEADIIGETDSMVYICLIQFFNNHYNFTPIGTYLDGEYHAITEDEIANLLPKSEKRNINFSYAYNYSDVMSDRFKDNGLIVMACGIDSLEENRNSDGVLLPTGYKMRAEEGCTSGKIQFLSDVGLYRLISKDELDDDILTQRILRLEEQTLVEGESVLIDIGDGFFAGPYKIKYQPTSRRYVIITQENTRTGFISGYNEADCRDVLISTADDRRYIARGFEKYYRIKDNAEQINKDLITDDELFNAFAEAIKGKNISDMSSSDMADYVEQQRLSILTGKAIPEDIKRQRVQKIQAYFDSAHEMDEITSKAYDVVCNLILKNKDSQKTEELLSAIIENRPDFLEGIQGIRIIQSKLEAAKQELNEIEQKKRDIIAQKGNQESKELSEQIENKKDELKKLSEKIKELENADAYSKHVETLKDEEKYLEEHNRRLKEDSRTLEKKFVGLMEEYSDKMADITFDGYVSNKMLQAASEWERGEERSSLEKVVQELDSAEVFDFGKDELIDYLVNTIKIARPNYDKNVILNILICTMQGFLTVFSGMPGCGKTSICNIVAKALGITDYSDIDAELKGISRYIPVSVERGWTSKRDFIGYFNPLTKSFEESNRDVFKGLKLLNQEFIEGSKKYPFIILLDEANLSSMEYYWADFMNVCDDRKINNTVNLGNDNVFYIPETLRFLATINNDHTTEALSPRLIDRAWIIILPKSNSSDRGKDISEDIIKHITWESLQNVFGSIGNKKEFDRETANTFEGIKTKLGKQRIYISPRVNIAIGNYWEIASELMEADEYGNQPDTIALDYAVAQKILPQLTGNGEEFRDWLDELKDFCSTNNLDISANLIDEMLKRGNRKMKYYGFFE